MCIDRDLDTIARLRARVNEYRLVRVPGIQITIGLAAYLLAERERLQRIEQAARSYCARNGTARYNRLVVALNGESEG